MPVSFAYNPDAHRAAAADFRYRIGAPVWYTEEPTADTAEQTTVAEARVPAVVLPDLDLVAEGAENA